MSLDDSSLTSAVPRPVLPVELKYGTTNANGSNVVPILGVVGICVAVLISIMATSELGSIVTGQMFARTVPTLQWETVGAAIVSLWELIADAILAVMLLAGSIGVLRRRGWGWRMLTRWAWCYLARAVVFISLQILIVAPSRVHGITALMQSRLQQVPLMTPAHGSGVVTGSYTYSFSAPVVAGWTKHTFTATQASVFQSAQIRPAIGATFILAAIGKAVICIIFPIILLIVLRLKSVREALPIA